MPKEPASSSVAKKAPSRARVTRASIARRAPRSASASTSTITQPARRAPTPLRAQASDEQVLRKQLIIGVTVFLVVLFGSVGVGIADEGQINVAAVVSDRNDQVERGEGVVESGQAAPQAVTVPKQNTSTQPDGGLRGMGKSEKPAATPPPAPTTASSTATTSEADASNSTDTSDEAALDTEAAPEPESTSAESVNE